MVKDRDNRAMPFYLEEYGDDLAWAAATEEEHEEYECYPAEKRGRGSDDDMSQALAMKVNKLINVPEIEGIVPGPILDNKHAKKRVRRVKLPNADKPLKVTDILNSQEISVSLAQLTDVSPWVAKELKKAPTPKTVAATPRATVKESQREQSVFISDAVLGDSAPRAMGVMSNIPCEVVLDGGSTGNMVSLAIVWKLGAEFLLGLDLLKGLHQIKAMEETIPKLTMTTPFGTF
jgi:hypothetical protein